MLRQSEVQIPRANVVRVFLRYQDFRVRVDDNSPVHYDVQVRREDSQGMKWLLTFRIFALDRKQRLIIFEYKWDHDYIQTVRREEVVNELVEKFADPLNAVPGRMEVR
jgi:hypothetical protein